MLAKCNAETCIHNRNNMCQSESIEMVNFEYYADLEDRKRELTEDEMKCSTYKSKYEN